jgi:hypothetical protein
MASYIDKDMLNSVHVMNIQTDICFERIFVVHKKINHTVIFTCVNFEDLRSLVISDNEFHKVR